jgi:uncharacterized protein
MKEKQIIDQVIAQKHIAVAGVSRNDRKFGSVVYAHLKKHGYQVYALNPNLESFNGDPCYKQIQDLPSEVNALVTVTKPAVTQSLIKDAAAHGMQYIWMQQGSEHAEAIAAAEEAGIGIVTKRCIMMFVEPVKSIHGFHRFILKLVGKYPN